MGKIALLVSREEMLYLAHNILQEKKYAIQEMRVIDTADCVTEARNSIAGGASIIIARGLQASLIKQYTNIPVVEIVMTAQEMALLIMKAKQIVKKPGPVIAVVGFQNMFCDMSYFESLYDIELRTCYAKNGAELSEAARKAVEEEADLIIGGDTAVKIATEAEIPSLFLSITEDSLKNAFSMAERVDYAMGVEKKNAAQMETLLDYSYSGVVRVDAAGLITMINPVMEEMLCGREGMAERGEQLPGGRKNITVGQKLQSVFPELDGEAVYQVFQEGREYSLFMQVNHISVFAVLAPVLVENRVDGGILTCHKMKKRQSILENGRKKQRSTGMIPQVQFGDICQMSKAMQECVRLAKLYALSEKPVVIMGEPGTEKLMIAQSIHNSSLHNGGPFLDVPCDGLSEEAQQISIFGEKGAAAQVNGGSLLIQDVGCLTSANQYRLYQLIRYQTCHGADVSQMRRVDVRVMVTSDDSLEILVAQGKFRRDLYYLLDGLTLFIPPFRERREDLRQKLDDCLKDSCERYARYHVLTQGAWKALLEYPWPGNLLQIENFCERLILTADRRSIDEVIICQLLEILYPEIPEREDGWNCGQRSGPAPGEGYGGEEYTFPIRNVGINRNMSEGEREICEALCRYDGSRQKTAEALGISKATLWRRMKKYGMESDRNAPWKNGRLD